MTATEALYVYGVVPEATHPGLFADVEGIAGGRSVRLVEAKGVAAIVSPVPLGDFEEEALEQHLRDPAWLEEKVRAHDRVLAAAVGRVTVLPLRFGSIYRGEDHVRTMLAERDELADDLVRLDGLEELGVKALLDTSVLRGRLESARGADVAAGSGRAYMLRKGFERELDAEVRTFAATCADESHARLAAASVAARANPTQAPEVAGGDMILNGAYLVRFDAEEKLRSAVAELAARYGDDGVSYELTGPWPPYNFVEEGET
ncbi:MAG TPA: GvpL/GvpF family gas vesicle protein [Gaiellaceae bacterium]